MQGDRSSVSLAIAASVHSPQCQCQDDKHAISTDFLMHGSKLVVLDTGARSGHGLREGAFAALEIEHTQ